MLFQTYAFKYLHPEPFVLFEPNYNELKNTLCYGYTHIYSDVD